MYVAAAAPFAEGENKLLSAAMDIGNDHSDDVTFDPHTGSTSPASFVGRPTKAKSNADDPPAGSYEAFMRFAGGG